MTKPNAAAKPAALVFLNRPDYDKSLQKLDKSAISLA